ncbi:MAG TPA: hypothetical protein DEH78_33280 [Solibacterales bacterium]|nr:hypothetical protein [Bryobacterales bacterium]
MLRLLLPVLLSAALAAAQTPTRPTVLMGIDQTGRLAFYTIGPNLAIRNGKIEVSLPAPAPARLYGLSAMPYQGLLQEYAVPPACSLTNLVVWLNGMNAEAGVDYELRPASPSLNLGPRIALLWPELLRDPAATTYYVNVRVDCTAAP